MATHALTVDPRTQRAPAPSGRWLEVVSHLDPRYGGLSAVVPELASCLLASGSDIDVAAFCVPGERFVPASLDAGQVSFWPASRKQWLTQPALRSAFTRSLSAYQGIHIHGLWEQSTAVAASSARDKQIPYLLSAHGMLEPWALQAKRLKKLVYAALFERRNVAAATALHALTHAEADQYVAFGARSPIAVIPNAVDIPTDRPDTRSYFLNTFPILRGKRIVLFLARLHPKKGLDLLLNSWAAIASSWPDAHLVIAGPDTEGTQARLEQFVAGHNLGSTVLFTGMLHDRLKWGALASAEAFVLPSHSEGLSVGVLEAMGSGLPVIVTQACNMPEVEQLRAGWQINPVQDQLTTALSELLNNSTQQNSLIGSRGADLIHTRYDWASVSARMATVYRWIETGGPLPTSVDWVLP